MSSQVENWKILKGDAKSVLTSVEDGTARTCITSPPYWGLRNYGHENQIGMEKTVDEYIENLRDVCREVWRVLSDDGTFWLNLGDCYAGSGRGSGSTEMGRIQRANKGAHGLKPAPQTPGIKPKSLIGIPWRVAFALIEDGWVLRSDIVWAKPNAMPESVKDRPTRAHEYIFLFAKQGKYLYNNDAIAEPLLSEQQWPPGIGPKHANARNRGEKYDKENPMKITKKKNKRDVWNIATGGYKGAHFATFPEKLIEPCILAGSNEHDIVLDPFAGSGTTGVVALRHGRKFIGVEINHEYAEIARNRIRNDAPMFNNHPNPATLPS